MRPARSIRKMMPRRLRMVLSRQLTTPNPRLQITASVMSRLRAAKTVARPGTVAVRAYFREPRLGLDRTQSVDDRQFVGGAHHSRGAARSYCIRDLTAARISGRQD